MTNVVLFYLFVASVCCDILYIISVAIFKWSDDEGYEIPATIFGFMSLGSLCIGAILFLIFIIGIVKMFLGV